MSAPLIIDAHAHLDPAGQLVCRGTYETGMLGHMDRLGIRCVICSDHAAVMGGFATGLARMRRAFDQSGGRIRGLGVFDPRCSRQSMGEFKQAIGWEGLAGLKIHPTSHGVAGDDDAYRAVWEFAAEHDLTILTHSWSVVSHNPAQALSVPGRFERWVREFPTVRLVLGHAGGRGLERHDAVRMANEYPGVHVDVAGDIYCFRLIEALAASMPAEKILFGSDYPWTGASDHLTRVLLADIGDQIKARILGRNAARVYKLEVPAC